MRWILITISMLLSIGLSIGQDKELSHEEIIEIREKVDFSKTKTIRVPREMAENVDQDISSPSIRPEGSIIYGVKYIGIGLLLILGVGVLYLVLKDIRLKKKIEQDTIDLDQIKDIKKVDFDDVLQDALNKGDYRLAIRIKFLILMKALAKKEILNWKVWKTNRHYLGETRTHEIHLEFEPLVRIFEHFWYGSTSMSEYEYIRMYKKYDSLIKKVNLG